MEARAVKRRSPPDGTPELSGGLWSGFAPRNGNATAEWNQHPTGSRSHYQASPNHQVEREDWSQRSQDQPGRLGYAIRVREGNLPWELYYDTFIRHVHLGKRISPNIY